MMTRIKKLVAGIRAYERLAMLAKKPDAKVDPARFSEEEFPIRCAKCDYQLRGLPDGKCPECGTGFERGRRLVEQYAVHQGWTWRSRSARLWLWMVGCLFVWAVALLLYGSDAVKYILPSFPASVAGWEMHVVVLGSIGFAFVLSVFSSFLVAWNWRLNRTKRNHVLRVLSEQARERA